MLNKQKIFTKIKNHLLKQNSDCLSDDFKCRYRIGNKKCAIGCLIPNNLYKHQIEDASIDDIINFSENVRARTLRKVLSKSLKSELTYDELKFLRSLQEIHDSFRISEWKSQLKRFAEDYSLVY